MLDDGFLAALDEAAGSAVRQEVRRLPLDAFDHLAAPVPGPRRSGKDALPPPARGTGAGRPAPAPGDVSAPLAALVAAVDAVAAQVAVELPRPQALAEAAGLLAQLERLKVVALDRIGDVDRRRLHEQDGAPSAASWIARQRTSLDRGQATLARQLDRCPQMRDALHDGALTVQQARKVVAAVGTARRHLDRPDGLVDGADGEQVVRNVVVDGVRQVVCEALAGLDDGDPRLAALLAAAQEVADRPTTQLARLEAAFLLVAAHVEDGRLTALLGRLLDAVLPQQLEDRAASGNDERGLTMVRRPDGTGWTITDGDLDLECGELLHALLTAEQAVDPDSPADTAAYAALRDDGWDSTDPLPADVPGCAGGPRPLRQRRHDALRNGLRRYLDAGLAGVRDKVAPHLSVTVGVDQLDGVPGALPAVASSGATLPRSLVLRWSCSAALTRFVLSRGRKVLEASHTARTLTGLERRAKHVEAGGQCQGAGCHRGPGAPLVPHHATPWAATGTTSLADTVLLCAQTHQQLHSGKTVRLKDGRLLGPDGWIGDG